MIAEIGSPNAAAEKADGVVADAPTPEDTAALPEIAPLNPTTTLAANPAAATVRVRVRRRGGWPVRSGREGAVRPISRRDRSDPGTCSDPGRCRPDAPAAELTASASGICSNRANNTSSGIDAD